jgi:hypothetical protein
MKRKLRLEELSVASFSTGEDGFERERGTVRGMADTGGATYTQAYVSCVRDSCDPSCQGLARTCWATCDDHTCGGSCPVGACP